MSHHLLAADVIGAWFAELRRARDVSLFVIISPRHFVEGMKDISPPAYLGRPATGRWPWRAVRSSC